MKPGSILLVEDDADDIDLTLMSLRQHAFEHPVVIARDGMQALEILSGPAFTKIALVILDLNLPKLSGLEVLERIRGQEGMRTLPVVILSSSNEPTDRRRADFLGVKAYFLKPVNPDEFEPIVQRLRMILDLKTPLRPRPR